MAYKQPPKTFLSILELHDNSLVIKLLVEEALYILSHGETSLD